MVFLIARENRRKKEKENKSSGVANVSYYVISTFQSVQSLHQFTLSLSCVLVVVDYVITFHCDDDGHFHGLNTQLLNISKQFSCTNRTPSSESTRVECALNDAHVLSLCMPSNMAWYHFLFAWLIDLAFMMHFIHLIDLWTALTVSNRLRY